MSYTVITYNAAGETLTVYTTPPGYDADPKQLVKNALDLDGSSVAKVWEGDREDTVDRPPLHTVRWE